MISETYLPFGGGAELATHLILERLVALGHEVLVLTGVKEPEALPGARFLYHPLLKPLPKPLLWVSIAALALSRFFRELVRWADVVYIPRRAYPLACPAKAANPRARVVVHLHDYQPLAYSAAVLAEGVKQPPKGPAREAYIEYITSASPLKAVVAGLLDPVNRALAEALRCADLVVTVSRRHYQIITEGIKWLRGKTIVSRNPPPKVPKIEKEVRGDVVELLYVGGEHPLKGYQIAIEAVKQLALEGYKVVLHITGELRWSKPIARPPIIVHGRVSKEELYKLHKRARVLIFPSIWEEPSPYTIAESTALGTVVIAAKVGGVPEIVNAKGNELALLFEAFNAKKLVKALKTVVEGSLTYTG